MTAETVSLSADQTLDVTPMNGDRLEMSRIRSLAVPTSISLETVLYLVIIVLAVASRFWGLGDKTLHHDESLHAYYSWTYFTGGGYRHDPLMHGPFLFHMNALVYFLFGDSDASSRYAPALFGVILVGLPYLLRGPKHLGRYGALAASLFLLVSPSITYQSRYIRHDIYTLVGTLALLICIVRYIERPQRRWLIGAFAMVAFLLTNHEIVFAILVIFGLFLYGTFLVERIAAWRDVYPQVVRNLILLHGGYVVAMFGWLLLAPPQYMEELLDIPWEGNPSRSAQMDYWQDLLTNPLILVMFALTIAFLVGLYLVLRPAQSEQFEGEGWVDSLLWNAKPGSVSAAIKAAWDDKVGLGLAVFAGLAIFVPLYTSLFTNTDGLFSSTIATDGTLLYWLGQHDYQRGEQPWFYFLLLLPQYEFLVFIPGLLMTVIIGARAIRGLFGKPVGPRFFFQAFVATWFVLIFAGLSYAGEKMPWLVVHIALPGVLLAAAFAGGIVEQALGVRNDPQSEEPHKAGMRRADLVGVAMMLLLGFGFVALAASFTSGSFVAASVNGGWERVVTATDAENWWQLAILPLVGMIALVVYAWFRGVRRAGFVATFAMLVGLVLMQVHAGWNLNYYQSDVPTEMLVYTQSSPDIKRIMAEIDQFSAEKTGGKGLEVVYDSGMAWPMQWYLRNYQNKQFAGATLDGAGGDAPIILAVSGLTEEGNIDPSLYTSQEYVLRWWFPEELYRDFAIAPELPVGRSAWKSTEEDHGVVAIGESLADSLFGLFDMEVQSDLYRLTMFRELEQPLGQYNFRMYVRNDLLPEFNDVRY